MEQEVRERFTRVVAASSVAFSAAYIVWRWGWTLNPEALWFSVPLAIAETYGLVTAFFLTFTGWRLSHRKSRPPLRGRTVDVFVTTYDEPLEIIRKTALAARELTYPHETWILDDGRRDEVEAMAGELGVKYLRRDTNEHAKAGNLNNALRHSSGEFILQLDADHVPLPHMIDRLIGFFADTELAFVQSPQDFYNTDAFTYEVNADTRRLWEDQQLFFRVLQPGKDRVNAAFFVGSCALIRRRAIEDVGGFATRTITEDIETSMLLHARGWRSAYYGESLAYGLAPATATAFHVQHLRWGQGAMQALRHYRPLRMKGLTLAQRIAYLDSLTTYLGGFQRLILYCAPLVFFITGAFPLRVSAGEFAAVFVPYIVLQWAAFKLLARGNGSLLLADRFAMAKFFTHIRSVTGYLTRRRLRFRVTPKGALAHSAPATFVPQLSLIVATVGALAFAFYERKWGYADEVPGWGSAAVWANVVFAVWNAWVAASIVRNAFAGRQQRAGFRFAESLPVALQILRSDGKLAAIDVAVTGDLSPTGAALRTMHPIPEDARVELTLPLSRASVAVKGRLVNRREQVTPYGTVHIHGIEFEDLSVDARDAIELHCAQHATPLERQRYDQAATARWRLRNIRGETRVSVGMPAEVFVGPGAGRSLGLALLEDVSPLGARIVIDHPVQPDSHIRLAIPGTSLDASGSVVFVHTLETSLGMRFVVGISAAPARNATAAVTHERLAFLGEVFRLAARYAALAREMAARSGQRAAASGRRAAESGRRFMAWMPTLLTRQRPVAASNDMATEVPEAVTAPLYSDVEAPVAAVDHDASDTVPVATADHDVSNAAAVAAEEHDLPADVLVELEHDAPEPGALLASVDADAAQEQEPDAIADVIMIEEQAEPAIDDVVMATAQENEPTQGGASDDVEDAAVEAGAIDADDAGAVEPDEPAVVPPTEMHAPPAASDDAVIEPFHSQGEEEMPSAKQSLVPIQQGADAAAPALFTVRGKTARIDGSFGDAEFIEIHGDVSGDLRVDGIVVIGEQGKMNGEVTAQRIRVEGEFTGDLRASEDIEIAESGVVNGTLQCDELVIDRGGVFNGTATRTSKQASQSAVVSRSAANRTEQQKISRAPLADVATPPAAGVLDFTPDDDAVDQYQGRQIPLA